MRKGIIHFHDADYFAQPMYNCCLVNLEDMLQNGTVITGTKIDKPHSALRQHAILQLRSLPRSHPINTADRPSPCLIWHRSLKSAVRS
jgi:hypothetical protein